MAIEDKCRAGVVFYDPRVDWKLKADLVVLIKNVPIRISAFFGDEEGRPRVEARREVVERERKKNTMESSQWQNTQLEVMQTCEISRLVDEPHVVNGVRLFSLQAINSLLERIYEKAGMDHGWFYTRPGELTQSARKENEDALQDDQLLHPVIKL